MPDEPRPEAQALSEVAEMSLSAQLDEIENLDVDVRTNLLKMVQGQADSVSIAGQGLVMQKDIRVHELEVHTDKIAIDLLSAILGQIELNRPVDATARLVLTEQDINRALNSDYIRHKFPCFEVNVDGEIVGLEPQQMKIHLSGGSKVRFRGTILLHERGNTRQVGFNAAFRPRTHSQPVMLEEFNCSEGEGISLELTVALMNKVRELMNLPYFEIEGVALRVKQLDVHEGSLTLHTEAYVRQLPELNRIVKEDIKL
ncbi:MAG TPA: DUF2993 domain-containing protein [Allocoleopsis sp.]